MDPLADALPRTRASPGRGRLPGARLDLRRPPRRLDRRRRLLQLLPDQEPRAPGATAARSSPTTRRLAAKVALLRSHGEGSRHHHEMPARTDRLDALQAAILRVKLDRLDEANRRRREAGAALTRGARRDLRRHPRRRPRGPRPRLPPLRRPQPRPATSCAPTSTPKASPARSTTRRRSTCSPPTPTSAGPREPAGGGAARGRNLLAADLPRHHGRRDRAGRPGGRRLLRLAGDHHTAAAPRCVRERVPPPAGSQLPVWRICSCSSTRQACLSLSRHSGL